MKLCCQLNGAFVYFPVDCDAESVVTFIAERSGFLYASVLHYLMAGGTLYCNGWFVWMDEPRPSKYFG